MTDIREELSDIIDAAISTAYKEGIDGFVLTPDSDAVADRILALPQIAEAMHFVEGLPLGAPPSDS